MVVTLCGPNRIDDCQTSRQNYTSIVGFHHSDSIRMIHAHAHINNRDVALTIVLFGDGRYFAQNQTATTIVRLHGRLRSQSWVFIILMVSEDSMPTRRATIEMLR